VACCPDGSAAGFDGPEAADPQPAVTAARQARAATLIVLRNDIMIGPYICREGSYGALYVQVVRVRIAAAMTGKPVGTGACIAEIRYALLARRRIRPERGVFSRGTYVLFKILVTYQVYLIIR
jgi:hypothetical protein